MPATGIAGPAPEPSACVPLLDDASQFLAFPSQPSITDGDDAGGENVIAPRPPTAEDALGRFTRVRSRQPYTTTLLQKLYDRSPTVRALIDRIQQSNATVVVQLGTCKAGRFRGCVVNVTGSVTARHIWIMVDAHANQNSLLATIAHELQHAVEIVEHPDVFDVAGVVQLYRRLAFGACRDGLSEECETERALETEHQVLTELNTQSARVTLDRWPLWVSGRSPLQPSSVPPPRAVDEHGRVGADRGKRHAIAMVWRILDRVDKLNPIDEQLRTSFSNAAARAIAGKAPRHRWHRRQCRYCGSVTYRN
jgi:hypothetical protein